MRSWHAVPHPALGENVDRPGGIVAEPLAKPLDERPHAFDAPPVLRLAVPHLAKERVVREHPSPAKREHAKEFVFGRSELDLRAGDGDLATLVVDDKLAERKALGLRPPSKNGLDTGGELGRGERLHDVVSGA